MCCTIGMSGGNGGGLFAVIFSYDNVSSSSMSLTTVTTTGNTATGAMRCQWALLQQHDLWVVPVDSEWLCVCMKDGGLSAVCEQYCVSWPHC
jgi:hypothetical protein